MDLELYWETDGLHSGRMTPVNDENQHVRFLLRRTFSNHTGFKLLNADARLIGSIRSVPDEVDHFELQVGDERYRTLIRLAGSSHPLYLVRGSNWIVTGNMQSNHYYAYHGISSVFSTESLADGASIHLWTAHRDNAPCALLIVAALDQIRLNTETKQEPLSFSW